MKSLLILPTLLLVCCNQSITLSAFTDSYPNTPATINQTAELKTPKGWRPAGSVIANHGQLRLWPEAPNDGEWGPMIKVIFGRLDPTAPPTSQGQVKAYLEAIHDKEDSTVILERRSIVIHRRYGSILIWYLHSPQFGHRLHTEFISGNAGISIELLCDTPDELVESTPAFEFLIQSIQIKNEDQQNIAPKRRLSTSFKSASAIRAFEDS